MNWILLEDLNFVCVPRLGRWLHVRVSCFSDDSANLDDFTSLFVSELGSGTDLLDLAQKVCNEDDENLSVS